MISFAINIFITLSYSFMAVGLWMVFAAGMGNKQFKDKGISFAASGATLSIVTYIVTFAYILFFASRLGVPGSLMAGIVIAVLLFVLAYASTRSVFKQLGTGSITSGVGVAAVIFNGLLFVPSPYSGMRTGSKAIVPCCLSKYSLVVVLPIDPITHLPFSRSVTPSRTSRNKIPKSSGCSTVTRLYVPPGLRLPTQYNLCLFCADTKAELIQTGSKPNVLVMLSRIALDIDLLFS